MILNEKYNGYTKNIQTPPIKNNEWHKFVNMNRTIMID